jgi:hypothetical protein
MKKRKRMQRRRYRNMSKNTELISKEDNQL